MEIAAPVAPLTLSQQEVGFICHAIAMARGQFKGATASITEEYSLGPRGVWMLGLIANGALYPLDLTRMFRVGRSLVTAELARLVEAGLVTSRKSARDGRRLELALTPLGETVKERLVEELLKMLQERFASYTREELLFCARMLRDFARDDQFSL